MCPDTPDRAAGRTILAGAEAAAVRGDRRVACLSVCEAALTQFGSFRSTLLTATESALPCSGGWGNGDLTVGERSDPRVLVERTHCMSFPALRFSAMLGERRYEPRAGSCSTRPSDTSVWSSP